MTKGRLSLELPTLNDPSNTCSVLGIFGLLIRVRHLSTVGAVEGPVISYPCNCGVHLVTRYSILRVALVSYVINGANLTGGVGGLINVCRCVRGRHPGGV